MGVRRPFPFSLFLFDVGSGCPLFAVAFGFEVLGKQGQFNQMLLHTGIYLRHRMLRVSEWKLPVRSTWRVSCLPAYLDTCDLTRNSKFHFEANSRHKVTPDPYMLSSKHYF
ncbi:hypothetical protein CK203_078239 [Vitis vinifera]|uniref:Uncharacterized protein n=1 Tax=Vitis vinifera TaxID=29760 RepID=A0A438DKL5_VITVI|nr:hypothetical protein CK203_078239 [Vitis vinifera]